MQRSYGTPGKEWQGFRPVSYLLVCWRTRKAGRPGIGLLGCAIARTREGILNMALFKIWWFGAVMLLLILCCVLWGCAANQNVLKDSPGFDGSVAGFWLCTPGLAIVEDLSRCEVV